MCDPLRHLRSEGLLLDTGAARSVGVELHHSSAVRRGQRFLGLSAAGVHGNAATKGHSEQALDRGRSTANLQGACSYIRVEEEEEIRCQSSACSQ